MPTMEEDYAMFFDQLNAAEATLELDPTNEAFLELKTYLVQAMTCIEEVMPHLKERMKNSKPTAPAAKNNTRVEDPASAATSEPARFFNTNEQVMARRKGEPYALAVILSVLGPPNNPNYVVRFKGDRSTATLPGHDVKPLATPATNVDKKHRLEDDELSLPINLPAKPSSVISAPAALNPEFLKKKEKDSPQSHDAAGNDKKPRKVGNKKRLEENRTSWQNFQGHMQKKQKTKDSMFRTGEGLHAKVGVIGSGQGMRKDQKRKRNEYARVEDNED